LKKYNLSKIKFKNFKKNKKKKDNFLQPMGLFQKYNFFLSLKLKLNLIFNKINKNYYKKKFINFIKYSFKLEIAKKKLFRIS
jgi:hypothetical protein